MCINTVKSIPYSAKFLRAINFADFAVSLHNAKIISVHENEWTATVMWLYYDCDPQNFFSAIFFLQN